MVMDSVVPAATFTVVVVATYPDAHHRSAPRVSGALLHDGEQRLSSVERSDFLRCVDADLLPVGKMSRGKNNCC